MRNIWDAVSGEWIEHHEPLPEHDRAWNVARWAVAWLLAVGTVAVVWHVIARGLV